MGEDAGEVVGPIAAGFLWTTCGIPVMLGARVLLAIVTEVYAAVLARSLERQEDDAIRGGPGSAEEESPPRLRGERVRADGVACARRQGCN